MRSGLTPCQAAGECNANRIPFEFRAVCRCHILSPLVRASLSEDRNETATGPKARILEAVREVKGEGTAQLLDHLKKGEMATEAERLLKGSDWLPEVLRCHDLAALDDAEGQGALEPVSDAGQAEDVVLPAFLTADLPGDGASMMAAE